MPLPFDHPATYFHGFARPNVVALAKSKEREALSLVKNRKCLVLCTLSH